MNEKSKSAEKAAATGTTPLLSSPDSHSAYGVVNNTQQQQHQVPNQNQNDDRRRRSINDGLGGLFSDHTFSAAMMHSVGALGRDEYVDSRGAIHLISIRKRRRRQTVASGAPVLSKEKSIPDYGQLQDLFRKTAQKKSSFVHPEQSGLDENGDEDGDDEEFEVEDQVEGGSMTAAIFGVIKGTVGPAILYLPKGFQQAGWACAIPALIVATFAYIYSAHRLLECWKVEDARQQFLAQRMGEIQSLLEQHHSNDGEYNNNNDNNG